MLRQGLVVFQFTVSVILISGTIIVLQQLDFMQSAGVTGYLTVTGAQARDTAQALAREEGIFGGFSAGANVAAALDLLAGPERDGTVGVIICDSGLKYLSTDLWE